MSKLAKKKAHEQRKVAKKARKTTNYLRQGSKLNQTGRRQKRKKHYAKLPLQPLRKRLKLSSGNSQKREINKLRGRLQELGMLDQVL